MFKFIVAALFGTALALTYNYFKHKETEQPAPVKQTVTVNRDNDLSYIKVLKDTDRRILCFFSDVSGRIINCVIY